MDIRMKWYYRLAFTLLLFIVLFVFIKLSPIWMPIVEIILKVVSPFIIGAFITYLLHPVIEMLHRKGLHRGMAVALIYILFFGGLGYGLYKGIPVFIHQLEELTENAPDLANQYRGWIQSIQEKTKAWPPNLQDKVDNGIESFEVKMDGLVTKVLNGAMEMVNSFIIIMLIPFISFYMLKDINAVKKAAWFITPKKWRKSSAVFIKDVNVSLGSYIRGQLFVCFIIGAISSILFWLFHFKYPLVLGMIIGITNVIPYFGPIIGAVPAVIIACTMSVRMVIITIVIIIVLQFLEGNILSPYIVGKSLHLHPLIIMFALLAGEKVGGIVGMIVSVPILSVLKVALIHMRKHFGRREMNEG
ncbi:AI-2E family transporter [Niallia sp. 01092]|uniref:AI-2E family transporter n=1 Tax=unclassified Niallia TaxID=2837522 RepID=UPI003FD239CB